MKRNVLDTAPAGTGHRSARVTSLDGVRGAAAVLVMVWHVYMVMSSHLPLRLPLDDGFSSAAVIGVFFLLSGVVVSIPALRDGFDWVAYYPARALRLLLPAWAAFAFSIALIVLIPRPPAPGTWLQANNAIAVQPSQIVREGLLLSQWPHIDGPLWSLSWEVLFSLLLAAFVFVAQRTMLLRHVILAVAVAVAVTAVGNEIGNSALSSLPAFLIGAIAAAHWSRVMAAAQALAASRRHALWWSLILTGSLISVFASGFTRMVFTTKPLTVINHLFADTTIFGYAGLLFLFIGSLHAQRLLNSRPMQSLAGISFSLYLVHLPIVATVGFLAGPHYLLVPVVSIPLSFLTAWAFARFVETPSHRLGKRVGAATSRLAGSLRVSRPAVVAPAGKRLPRTH